MTVGGVGFQLSSYVISAERGYLPRDDAAHRVHDILNVLANQPQGPEPVGVIGNEGFFYHFLGVDGLRKQNFDFADTPEDESLNTVELSTIDTALAVAGVVTAGQYFDAGTATEEKIRILPEQIYGAVNWPFMLNPEPGTEQNQFFLGWKPIEQREGPPFEIPDAPVDPTGHYSGTPSDPATVDFYTDEGLLIALLAMGSPDPNHRLGRDVWDAMIRDDQGGSFVRTFPGSLFTYQFGSAWLDTERIGADNHPTTPIDFFENSKSAIQTTQQYAAENPNDRATWQNGWGEYFWGLSATEGPLDAYFAEAAPPAALASISGRDSLPLASAEAENGHGDGTLMSRSRAAGGETIQLKGGQSREFLFDVEEQGSYDVSLRYSNDQASGMGEVVELMIDGMPVDGVLEAKNTRPVDGEVGDGWNVFELSPVLGRVQLAPGLHDVMVFVNGGDGEGIELDVGLFGAPLEVGTTTVYGGGASILHTPQKAIESLWAMSQLDLNQPLLPEQDRIADLLHPRFGFADAFNLDVADGAISGSYDPADLVTDPIPREAESGTGDGSVEPRGNASGQESVLLHDGDSRSMSFDLEEPGTLDFVVRYSNDGSPDWIQVKLDTTPVGLFTTQNTRPPGGAPGSGWDVFFSSGPIGSVSIPAGSHTVEVEVLQSDQYGVEIDLVNLDPKPTGPWANFTGFSIDHGPMLVMIDNYLEDNFIPNLFMSNAGIQSALSTLFPDFHPPMPHDLGLYHDGRFYLDMNGNGRWDRVAGGDTFRDFGSATLRPGAAPVTGDWDGNGTDDLGLYHDGAFYLDMNGNGTWDHVAGGDTFRDFGSAILRPVATPVTGDWDGNGTDDLGLHNDGRFYLDTTGNGAWDTVAGGDTFRNFGINSIRSTGRPVIGQWAFASPLLAAGGLAAEGAHEKLTLDALTPIVDQAVALWAGSGLDQAEVQRLESVEVRIADLEGARLGEALGTTITMDINAAGYGWYVDATPGPSEELDDSTARGLVANRSGPVADRMDLLTVVLHELGHVLGHGDLDDILSDDVMNGWLPVGFRRM